MKDNQTKKEMIAQYKEREVVGGVYAIKSTQNGKLLLLATTDMQGSKNRFAFAQSTDSCVDMKLRSDWNRQGGGAFVFESLEELKKGETQTAKEFKTDIDTLKELWLDKLADRELY